MAELHTYKCTKCGQTMQRRMSRMMMFDYMYLEGKRNRYGFYLRQSVEEF